MAGSGTWTSSHSSRKMFVRLRGRGETSGDTQKLSPTGWPGVGYGSCPTMRTLMDRKGIVKARRMFGAAGSHGLPCAFSARRKSPMAWICGSTGDRACAQSGSMSSLRGLILDGVMDSTVVSSDIVRSRVRGRPPGGAAYHEG
ncbi:hypothetical protein BMIN_0371 [Bifidobacterium minimum]|uniref:Uncharacterized protein n=1 Tax=Bifidobacterium minimum TaxID=1693 RepID=A0A087BN76_9BIFI|nr:hypothetical protein BMIN_0371 [Bifidobacterium minimum]